MIRPVQLWFDLPLARAENPEPPVAEVIRMLEVHKELPMAEDTDDVAEEDADDLVQEAAVRARPADGRDAGLEAECRVWLQRLGLVGTANVVTVWWNSRLRSTAGYATFPAWKIELNPRLVEFDGQVERTLKHELAHLIAYHGAGRRKIEPHGAEWRSACSALGIPEEKAHHSLPLPRREVRRPYAYRCPACLNVVRRVRKFRYAAACSSCCSRHANGTYDARYRFELIADPAKVV
ncbi:MAG: SprT-like domain-containing protein [Verrucomicrobiaceae bacterium]|nr:SprT-like domain-containing protein [Verrucomicrobiaceae bacterium]